MNESRTIWCRYACILLGIWLATTPLTFTIHSAAVFWNDLICGLLIVVFSVYWLPWLVTLLGVWLLLAPLIFWAPDALSYLNDNLVGAFAITFSLLVPGVRHDLLASGPEIPPGWSYNPSSWAQRIPIIALAFVCYLSARYMAAYQLGYLDHIWDPLFGAGTLKVITSSISKSFPVADAGLGAFVYLLETLMGCKGSPRRWHTMPWIVMLFSFLVVPAGLVSIILIMLQPIVVGYWCGWCLLTAFCMLIMIALTVDEAAVVIQYLRRVKQEGKPFWKIFWGGGTSKGTESIKPVAVNLKNMKQGVTFSLSLLLSALIGGWLMFSEPYLNIAGAGANSNHILGALIVTVSMIAMADVIWSVRSLNILFGILAIIFPLVLEGFPPEATWVNFGLGIALIVLGGNVFRCRRCSS